MHTATRRPHIVHDTVALVRSAASKVLDESSSQSGRVKLMARIYNPGDIYFTVAPGHPRAGAPVKPDEVSALGASNVRAWRKSSTSIPVPIENLDEATREYIRRVGEGIQGPIGPEFSSGTPVVSSGGMQFRPIESQPVSVPGAGEYAPEHVMQRGANIAHGAAQTVRNVAALVHSGARAAQAVTSLMNTRSPDEVELDKLQTDYTKTRLQNQIAYHKQRALRVTPAPIDIYREPEDYLSEGSLVSTFKFDELAESSDIDKQAVMWAKSQIPQEFANGMLAKFSPEEIVTSMMLNFEQSVGPLSEFDRGGT